MKESDMNENLIRKRQLPGLIGDSIEVMRAQEETAYRVKNFLPDFRRTLNEESREKMCLWTFQVADFCDLKRSTVGVAMNFLDRFMCTKTGRRQIRNKKSYQLAAMTSLYLAIKLFDTIEIEVEFMAEMSRGAYEADQIVEMEKHILDGLQWRTHGPTALTFVEHFMSLLPCSVDDSVAAAIMEQARYQTELAVCDYDLVQKKPSEIGLAAILNAMESLDGVSMPLNTRKCFVSMIEEYCDGMRCESVSNIRECLEMLLTSAVGASIERVMEGRVFEFSKGQMSSGSSGEEEWRGIRSDNGEESSPVCVSRH
eukprot:CAMPEP_0118706274 /NCGR_PEP_ID=MMETSP0800-20121206/20447_1 /TAXON_ID=210618 ORGANISM="Striatella unipunctata, Strain CCMP2910" /NCGR_SAMPLE_ID=MMETSP0800 /ASSEMBLY_ACC=CAM_ASM_000638 /LENGTH=311 /DNA_ID=CAMNT_0006608751 /DNA_START=38 /DNA_END=973 /DNA_ORIENTATION=+